MQKRRTGIDWFTRRTVRRFDDNGIAALLCLFRQTILATCLGALKVKPPGPHVGRHSRREEHCFLDRPNIVWLLSAFNHNNRRTVTCSALQHALTSIRRRFIPWLASFHISSGSLHSSPSSLKLSAKCLETECSVVYLAVSMT